MTSFSVPHSGYANPALKLERFAPDSIRGFSAVVPNPNSEEILLKIYLDRGYQVRGEWKGKDLLLRAEKSDN